MMDSLTQSAMSLAQSAGLWGYWFAFFAALAETVFLLGLFLPGSALLLMMGMLAGQGYFDLGDLLFFAIAGATLGDNVNYFLGQRYGRHWLRQDRWFLKSGHVLKAEAFFSQHGGKSVFLSRFVPSAKEIMPFIAGMVGMKRRSFMTWNLLGAIGWGLQWIVPGYLFSQSLSLAHAWLSRVGILLLVLVAVILMFYAIRWSLMRYGPNGFRFLRSILVSTGVALRENDKIAHLARRFPGTTRFLSRRMDRSHWRGLPLTLTGVIGVYIVALFSGLAEDVVMGDAVVMLDSRINHLLASLRTPLFNQIFYAITSFGYWPVIALGTMAAVFFLWYRRRTELILPLAVSIVSCELLTYLGKLGFHRLRPEGGVLDASGFSFPSGHASISVAFYGFCCFLGMQFVQSWSTRVNLLLLAALIAFLIGVSRLYLGVHYLSDVLAGYLVGALGLALGVASTYLPTPAGPFRLQLDLPSGVRLTGALAAILGVLMTVTVFNLRQAPDLASMSRAPATASSAVSSPQMILQQGGTTARSMTGLPRAPVNLVFVARDLEQVRTCLVQAGWLEADPIQGFSVPRAYFNALRGNADPTAPLAPWFWNDQPQGLGLVKPGEKGRVFDREFLRVWSSGARLVSGKVAFAGTVGEEARADWQLVPQPLPAFNQALRELEHQLQQLGLANQVKGIAYPGDETPKSTEQLPSGSDRISLIELAPGC
ncbi:bifunctional DedA family/phosphatase PAP2 family protein [Marinobacter subterrani]|uniref:bifunctional DedA family/phosphatase PAP2 family protein n=1 Tax=Marinobacter subterrani TaxID=1658765 RepID=UPI002354D501|nr:bifunctional DedA family/phosphatase PAP2 family protein [Marinobacter subterrani]